jgi:hypothetical protein
VLIIKVAAAFLLLLGSGLIFKALVEMDAPRLRLRPFKRNALPADVGAEEAVSMRRAA